MNRFSQPPRPLTRPSRAARALLWAALAVAGCAASQALAAPLGLAAALQAARSHDAQYRSAEFQLEATRHGENIARAQLLPNLALTASGSAVTGSRTFPNAQNQEVRVPLDYSAPQGNLSLRVPLFNFEALSGYRAAQAETETAGAVFETRGLDLLERLGAAYVQHMLAAAAVDVYDGQVKSFEQQLQQAQQRFEQGEGTLVQIAQAQASLDVARTRVAEVQEQLAEAGMRLERLTGVPGAQSIPLPTSHRPLPLVPDRLGDWLEMAVRQSPTLRAQELSREVARQVTMRQRAGHLPKVDIVASLSHTENDQVSNIGQTNFVRSLGVQLVVPLYSGGGVDASVRQAKAREAQVEEEVRREREGIEIDVQRFYLQVVHGEKRLAAYETALRSAELAVRGARRALETGLGTQAQLAEAENVYFAALRDLTQTRVEHLQARLRLFMRAGMPPQEAAAEIDRLLQPAPAATTASAQPPQP